MAGALSSTKPLGRWWAAVPKERWPQEGQGKAYLDDKWQEPWGDRRQEIVFIGAHMDFDAIKAKLDACLVPATDATSLDSLPTYKDPLPIWQAQPTEQAA